MRWGIDLGGTKIEAVVLDDELQVLCRKRLPTEAEGGMPHIIRQIGVLLNAVEQEVGHRPLHLGIGTPGTTDPKTGILHGSNTQAINEQPFLAELRKALKMEVTMANDANCFALAETKMGVVHETCPQARVVFGVIMGTGTGGGIIVDGKVLEGRHGSAGEWGHTFLDESGGTCYCGDSGCTERILAGPSLERFYRELTGEGLSLPEIDARFRAGTDVHAIQTMQRLVHFFGLGLSNVINILDPDVIVLGGGVSNLDVLYSEGVESVRRHVFNPTFDTPILRPALGDSAGVFGAALLGETAIASTR